MEKWSISVPDTTKYIAKSLRGDGDFRSNECIELLKQADIVVTNPPFSLFREYVGQLIKYNKKFLIVGPLGAISYKETFIAIKNNGLWLGINSLKSFRQPDGTLKKFGNICWHTNLHHNRRNEKLILDKRYDPKIYPRYENYDAINVDKTKDIPKDYNGLMGVPISFMIKYNPNQFEILDQIAARSISQIYKEGTKGKYLAEVNGIKKYARIIVKRK